MENKYYKVSFELEAPDMETAERLLDKALTPIGNRLNEESITDPEERHFEARIRYEEDWNGKGEYYIFENKWSDEDEWGLDTAFKLVDDRLSYQALTKIRELMRLGIPFDFA